MRTYFPTRQALSRTLEDSGDPLDRRSLEAPAWRPGITDANETAVPLLDRVVLGLDRLPRPMTLEEIEALGDLFSREVLLKGALPLTVRSLFEAIANIAEPRQVIRHLFLIAEGGQARLKDPQFAFNGRLVVTWQADAASKPDLLLSTVPVADDPQALMQLIAWSEKDGAYHYFERERRTSRWMWAGNSFHALAPPTRGQGPFDSHVNGSLVMKELKAPWSHWHSISGTIAPEAFPPASELVTEPLFAGIDSADKLENIVKIGVRRWTRSRVDQQVIQGTLQELPAYLRQLLWCTSVNLVSSTRMFGRPVDGAYPLPATFFYDFDAFAFLEGELGGDVSLVPPGLFAVQAGLYESAVARVGLATPDETDQRLIEGDSHFAFLVPERAFEDQAVLRELVAREALSPRTALCLLMVDFPNPVFSPRRGALLAHAPDEAQLGQGGADFDTRLVAAIRAANPEADSPEAEFLAFFDQPDLVTHSRTRLAAYRQAVLARLADPLGVEHIVELADSRRRVFARRPLGEFRSTIPVGRNPQDHLAMAEDAAVFLKSSTMGEEDR